MGKQFEIAETNCIGEIFLLEASDIEHELPRLQVTDHYMSRTIWLNGSNNVLPIYDLKLAGSTRQ
jgi:hypothetical protein